MLIPDLIRWVEWVGDALRGPLGFCNVVVLDVVVYLFTVVLPLVGLLSLSSVDVKAVQSVSWREFFLNDRLAAFNVVDQHGIAHEFGRLRCHISETRQFVDWVQRVRWFTLC